MPNLPAQAGFEGVRGRETAKMHTPIRSPPIRNPRNPFAIGARGPRWYGAGREVAPREDSD
eukprot:9944731-Alexandrium_andersonii.AAC.1